MPKQVVTKQTLPKIMKVLDKWEGKLTWPLFCDRIAEVLGVESVSRHTLLRYEGIQHRFKVRQQELRDEESEGPRDYTLEVAQKRIRTLEAQVRRLEETNTLLLDQFRRWQYNAHAEGVRPEALDKPLPEVNRSGHRRRAGT